MSFSIRNVRAPKSTTEHESSCNVKNWFPDARKVYVPTKSWQLKNPVSCDVLGVLMQNEIQSVGQSLVDPGSTRAEKGPWVDSMVCYLAGCLPCRHGWMGVLPSRGEWTGDIAGPSRWAMLC